MSAPLRMRTSTIEASPAEMGKFLRRLGDDIERADGDIVLIALSVYPNERDPLGEGKWDVQIIVDAAEARGEQPAPPTTCPTCGSDTPMVCHIGLVRPHHHGIIGDGSCCCPDSWHGEQR